MKALLALFILLSAMKVSAQTIVIADIDDTLKLAHIPNLAGSVEYVKDSSSSFTGMNSLFQLVHQDSNSTFLYVSNAPEWLMKKTHLAFLKNNKFPSGQYIGRTSYSAESHKLITIRKLLSQYHPKRVLFVGDNSEQDSKVYGTIAKENRAIEFSQYIHIVYAAADLKNPVPLAADQIGYVTSIEMAADLRAKGWLSASSEAFMRQHIMPRILNERPGGEEGSVAFPDFMNCKEIQWRWDIPGLNEKINQVCR
jgi:hypothetical protein